MKNKLRGLLLISVLFLFGCGEDVKITIPTTTDTTIQAYVAINKDIKVDYEGILASTSINSHTFAIVSDYENETLVVNNGRDTLKVYSVYFKHNGIKTDLITKFINTDLLSLRSIKTEETITLSIKKDTQENSEFREFKLNEAVEVTEVNQTIVPNSYNETQAKTEINTISDNPLKGKLDIIMFLVGLFLTPLLAKFKDSKLIIWIGSTSYRLTVVTMVLAGLILIGITAFSKEGISLFLEILQGLDFVKLMGLSGAGIKTAQGLYDLQQTMKSTRQQLDHGI